MKLIDHWRKAWRLSSVQIAMIIAALGALQAGLAGMGLPDKAYAVINTILAVTLAVARIVAQPTVTTGAADAEQKDSTK